MSNAPQTPIPGVDSSGPNTGTIINAENLNYGAMPGPPGYLLTGVLPAASSYASLTLPLQAGGVFVNPGVGGAAPQFVAVAAQNLSMPASQTSYIDISTTGTITITQSGVVTANSLRVMSVTTSGTGITGWQQLARWAPLTAYQVQADQAPPSGNRAIGPLSTLADDLANIRQDDAALFGTHPNTRRPIVQVGQVALTGGGTRLAMYMGTYLWVPTSSGMQILDISDATTPVSAGNINTANQCNAAAQFGHYALLGTANNLSMYSLDNPDVSSAGFPVEAQASPTTDIIVSGRYMIYTARAISTGIHGFDLAATSAPPRLWTNAFTDAAYMAVTGDGNWAIVTQGTQNKVQIVRLRDGASGGSVAGFNNPAGIATVGRYAYVANKGGGTLATVDLKDMTAAPSIVGTALNLNSGGANVNAAPNQIIAAGDYLYVSGSGVVSVVSIKQPEAPTLVTTFNVGGASAATTGMYAWDRYLAVCDTTNNLLRIFDLSGVDIAAATIGNLGAGRLTVHEGAQVYGGITTDRTDIGAGGLIVDGDAAFTAAWTAPNALGSAVPTIVAGSGMPAGGTATLVAGSTNRRGSITLAIGPTGIGANTQAFTLTFGGAPLPAIPAVNMTTSYPSANSAPAPYIVNKTASGFQVYVASSYSNYTITVDYTCEL